MEKFFEFASGNSIDQNTYEIFTINVCLRHPAVRNLDSIFVCFADYLNYSKGSAYPVTFGCLNDFTVHHKNAVIAAEREKGVVINTCWPSSAAHSSLFP